jgi:hypothetical protein
MKSSLHSTRGGSQERLDRDLAQGPESSEKLAGCAASGPARRPKPPDDGTISLVRPSAQWPAGKSELVKSWPRTCPATSLRRTWSVCEGTLADRARLPREEDRPGAGPLREPLIHRPAPARHPRHAAQFFLPEQRRASNFCQDVNLNQYPVATWTGACPACQQAVP